MRILLFGGSGQLGFEIEKRGRDLNFDVVSPIISEVDISDGEQVQFLTKKIKPSLVVNCAAYTAVDKAEIESKVAFKINGDGAANVAQAAKDVGARAIHISTDYVFDGNFTSPIREDAPTNPINVYGASKLEGERQFLDIIGNNGVVVRTSSLHGQKGENFVHTMIRLFKEKESVSVVSDQFMSPTYAGWLSEVVLDLGRIDCSGVVHASCKGVTSWFDFASKILEMIRPYLLGRSVTVVPIGAASFSRPAKRPAYSAFDCTKLAGLLKREPIKWEEGLRLHLSEIGYGAK